MCVRIVVPSKFAGKEFGLRWFTPTNEVVLCGHATMASAAVLFNVIGKLVFQYEFVSCVVSTCVSNDAI